MPTTSASVLSGKALRMALRTAVDFVTRLRYLPVAIYRYVTTRLLPPRHNEFSIFVILPIDINLAIGYTVITEAHTACPEPQGGKTPDKYHKESDKWQPKQSPPHLARQSRSNWFARCRTKSPIWTATSLSQGAKSLSTPTSIFTARMANFRHRAKRSPRCTQRSTQR